MNLQDIKNLILEEGKVVFIENEEVMGVFLSYEEYRKMIVQKSKQNPASSLPLFDSKIESDSNAAPSPMTTEDDFADEAADIMIEEAEGPEVVVMHPEPKPVKTAEPGPDSSNSEKELSIDDLPF